MFQFLMLINGGYHTWACYLSRGKWHGGFEEKSQWKDTLPVHQLGMPRKWYFFSTSLIFKVVVYKSKCYLYYSSSNKDWNIHRDWGCPNESYFRFYLGPHSKFQFMQISQSCKCFVCVNEVTVTVYKIKYWFPDPRYITVVLGKIRAVKNLV